MTEPHVTEPAPTEPAAHDRVVLHTIAEMREWRAHRRGEGKTVAFVPTMGALHEGHLSLIDVARANADAVVVSVFVNPTQFGPSEDFDEYPRDFRRDTELSFGRGADAVFVPKTSEVYPGPQTIWVEPGALAERLCGPGRPGHFRGVLTVVAKLFAMVSPDVAVFGQKDFQQSVLVRRMVEELQFPIRILVGPTVREPDGLALSSRNEYLSASQRQTALALSRGLRAARERFAAGERDRAALEKVVREELEVAGAAIEYVQIVDPDRLEPPDRVGPADVCAIAARVGTTRLIDNTPLGGASSLDALPGASTGGT
jgi:pantoate--beta-alanine ligase